MITNKSVNSKAKSKVDLKILQTHQTNEIEKDSIIDESLLPFNKSSFLHEKYEKLSCDDLIDSYEKNPDNYKVFKEANSHVEKMLDVFFINKNNTQQAIKEYVKDLLSSQDLKQSPIEFGLFMSNFIPFYIFILLTLIINFIFCACSCYEYCPIICRISDQKKSRLKVFSIIFYAFSAINLIIPATFGITKFE